MLSKMADQIQVAPDFIEKCKEVAAFNYDYYVSVATPEQIAEGKARQQAQQPNPNKMQELSV